MKGNNTGHGDHKVVALTDAQLRNLIQEAIITILALKGLTKESLLADFQRMMEAAIEKIVPKHDPDEDVPLNVKGAAKYFNVTRQVISRYQNVIINGEPVLKFNPMGQISLAQCRRVLNSKIIQGRPNARKKKK